MNVSLSLKFYLNIEFLFIISELYKNKYKKNGTLRKYLERRTKFSIFFLHQNEKYVLDVKFKYN